MSKQRVIVLAVTVQGLSKAEAARRYGVSRQWVHALLARHRNGGLEAVEPRSRRPNSNPRSVPEALAARILALRQELDGAGLDCGPLTIAWHLEREGRHAPSTSTIRRILHTAGLIRPEPKKRPKALADLNEQLEKFRHIYNHERPHRALDRQTPATAYAATPKAAPAGARQGDHWRRRIDRVDQFGKLTLRYAGRLRHIGIGRAYAGKHVLMLIHDTDVTISDAATGEIIRELTIDPTRDYQPRQRKTPRSEDRGVNDDPTHP